MALSFKRGRCRRSHLQHEQDHAGVVGDLDLHLLIRRPSRTSGDQADSEDSEDSESNGSLYDGRTDPHFGQNIQQYRLFHCAGMIGNKSTMGAVDCSSITPTGQPLMTNHMPSVPPAKRSPKGPGSNPDVKQDTSVHHPRADNAAEQGETANVKQNTTNKGYFCQPPREVVTAAFDSAVQITRI